MSRRISLAAAVVLVAVAGIAAIRLGHEPPSDGERIRAIFDDAARAAGEKRVSDCVAAVSERFRGAGLDRQAVKQFVAFHVLRGEWVSISIAGARVAVEGDAARANVDAVLVRGSGKGKPMPALLPGEASAYRFICRLEREKDSWRIVAAEWRPVGLSDALAGPPEPDASSR